MYWQIQWVNLISTVTCVYQPTRSSPGGALAGTVPGGWQSMRGEDDTDWNELWARWATRPHTEELPYNIAIHRFSILNAGRSSDPIMEWLSLGADGIADDRGRQQSDRRMVALSDDGGQWLVGCVQDRFQGHHRHDHRNL